MLREVVVAFHVLMLAVGSGITAGFILRTELPIQWLMCAGLGGVVLEPILKADYGPRLFHHYLLASIAGSAAMILGLRVVTLILQTWRHQYR